jgi:hypothetical protein
MIFSLFIVSLSIMTRMKPSSLSFSIKDLQLLQSFNSLFLSIWNCVLFYLTCIELYTRIENNNWFSILQETNRGNYITYAFLITKVWEYALVMMDKWDFIQISSLIINIAMIKSWLDNQFGLSILLIASNTLLNSIVYYHIHKNGNWILNNHVQLIQGISIFVNLVLVYSINMMNFSLGDPVSILTIGSSLIYATRFIMPFYLK